MQRLVALVSRLTAGFDSASSSLQMGEHSVRALAAVFPDTAVILFERQDATLARVVDGVRHSGPWQSGTVRIREVPGLEAALSEPGGVSSGFALERPMLCASIPRGRCPKYAVMIMAPVCESVGEPSDLRAALEITRQLIAARPALGKSTAARTAEVIHRAKVEWEYTADALPQIVGLLDWRGRIVRVNRRPEQWGLGEVRDVIGRDLHGLLHPACGSADCAMNAALTDSIAELWRGMRSGFELTDASLARDVIVALEDRTDVSRTIRGARSQATAVFTVTDVTPLRNTERQLTRLNRTLEQRVFDRTSALAAKNTALSEEIGRRREVEQLLRHSKLELEAMSERLINAQEAERKRISQDMHDSVGQMLGAIKYSLERAQLFLGRDEIASALPVLDTAIDRVRRLMDEVRHISMDLRPMLLDHLGAASAVRSLCREWQEVYHGVQMHTDIGISDRDIPASLITTVFRAVQECLHNVAQHAAAHNVVVSMRIEAGMLGLTVRDDGAGFILEAGSAQNPASLGLPGLRERVARAGGQFEIRTAPGAGTTVRLEWPIHAGEAARQAHAALN